MKNIGKKAKFHTQNAQMKEILRKNENMALQFSLQSIYLRSLQIWRKSFGKCKSYKDFCPQKYGFEISLKTDFPDWNCFYCLLTCASDRCIFSKHLFLHFQTLWGLKNYCKLKENGSSTHIKQKQIMLKIQLFGEFSSSRYP